MRTRSWLTSGIAAMLLTAGIVLGVGVSAGVDADEAQALTPTPTIQETARLLGYMWGDGEQIGGGVWDVNGPSGTSSLIEELIERHGGTFVDRGRLHFRLPAPYDWDEWITGLPDDSSTVRAAVQNPHFLAAVLETEASVGGQIYDQSACCVNGYTVGRLTELRDLLRSSGYSTASVALFANPNSGRVTVAASQWDDMRRDLRFVCPALNSDIRIPGGTNLDRYGNLLWIGSGSPWADVIRTDCTRGSAVPDARPQAGSCSMSLQGDKLRLDWTYTRGDVVIRVNGDFRATVSGRDRSWTGSVGGGNHNATIRVFSFGTQTTADCGATNRNGGATPVGGCVATAAGSSVALDWNNVGASSYSVRRNGKWVKTVTSTSTTARGSTGDAWIIRYRQANGTVVDVSCSSAAGDTSPCSITNRDRGVRVDWDGVDGIDDYQVRRNGAWIGEATGASRFDDLSGSVNDDYEIRYFVRGNRRSISC